MQIGQVHTEHHEITAELVRDFARLSGDFNPIHLDAEYASTTAFEKPIAHGLLTGALLSGIVGTRFPGSGTVLLGLDLAFKKPVFVGDRILFRLTVENVRPDKPIVTLLCEIFDSSEQLTCDGRVIVKTNR